MRLTFFPGEWSYIGCNLYFHFCFLFPFFRHLIIQYNINTGTISIYIKQFILISFFALNISYLATYFFIIIHNLLRSEIDYIWDAINSLISYKNNIGKEFCN